MSDILVQDAEKALTYGVDGIVVSNHGKQNHLRLSRGLADIFACSFNVRWSTSRQRHSITACIGNDHEVTDN